MENDPMKKLWILFQKNIKNIFYLILLVTAVSDFFIHRHHDFKIGEIHLAEAFMGIIFIFILAVVAKAFKIILFKSENYYNR